MATLIVTQKESTAGRLARHREFFHVTSGTFLSGMISVLGRGGTAVGSIDTLGTLGDLPRFVDVAVHPECDLSQPALRRFLSRFAERRNSEFESNLSRRPLPEGDATFSQAALLYVNSESRAQALADKIGALAVVHPADQTSGARTLAEGHPVVTTLAAMNDDFRIPRGTVVLLDPDIPSGIAKGRAETRAFLCDARVATAPEQEAFLAHLDLIGAGKPLPFGKAPEPARTQKRPAPAAPSILEVLPDKEPEDGPSLDL